MSIKVDEAERRCPDRRDARGGGRRSTDGPSRLALPDCPSCSASGAAIQAGEADGGWWFVCGACDHMWNERARAGDARTGEAAITAATAGAARA